MHRRRTALALAAILLLPYAALAQAAPKAAGVSIADSGEPITCTGTLSGAAKGSFTCRVTVTIEREKATFSVEPLQPVAGVRTLVPASFEYAMPLRAGTYPRSAITGGSAVVELTGGERYTASGRQGEVTLTLDSAERYRQARAFYVVSGTLRAHLVGDGQLRGEVVMELRF